MTRGIYGTPPVDLAAAAADAVQFSPLEPGADALELQPDASLDSMTMLAPRGRLERRYVIAQALRILKPETILTVMAHKTKGGTRLSDELAGFGCMAEEAARRHHRICTCQRPEIVANLDDALKVGAPRFVEAIGLWSQPGVFSWDRIDPGTALLAKHLPRLNGRGADFGCGIGNLTLSLLKQPSITHVTMIDADRRAVEAARRNVIDPRAIVHWADVRLLTASPAGLDFVVMNPPFHDGGAEDLDLGRLFLQRAAEALRPGGVCILVANRHLPYEGAMRQLFSKIAPLAQTGGYKVYEGTK